LDPSVLAGLVDQALASGHEAVKNGNLVLAEKSVTYAYNTAVQLPEDVTALRTRKVGECAALRAAIDELARNTAELEARQAERTSFTNAFTANMEQVREEQARTGALEKDQQELQDVKDYGAFGGLFVGGARAAGERAAALADEYSTSLYAAGAFVALLAVTVIVVKVA
jgi:hypothetical protein